MDLDLIFVGGLLLAAFSIPTLVSAFADRRWPTFALVLAVAGGVGIAYAVQEDSDRYTIANTDDVVVEFLGRFLN
jgi:hypothetical protein